MRYSVGQRMRFSRVLEECLATGRSFAVIHRGVVPYRADWRQSKGRPIHEIGFTIRQCFTDSDLDRVYGLTVDGVDLLRMKKADDFVAEFAAMAKCNNDFRCANRINWDVCEYAGLLNGLLKVAP